MFEAQRRPNHGEQGFTLIELMVVVLIIAILLAIAMPMFTTARTRAQDRAAQADVRTTFIAARSYLVDNDHFDDSTVPAFTSAETTIKMVASFSGATHEVQVLVGDAVAAGDKNAVCLTARSNSGTFFELKDIGRGANAGTTFDTPASAPTSCNGVPLPNAKW